MDGRRKTILALFIWAMAAVMLVAAVQPKPYVKIYMTLVLFG